MVTEIVHGTREYEHGQGGALPWCTDLLPNLAATPSDQARAQLIQRLIGLIRDATNWSTVPPQYSRQEVLHKGSVHQRINKQNAVARGEGQNSSQTKRRRRQEHLINTSAREPRE